MNNIQWYVFCISVLILFNIPSYIYPSLYDIYPAANYSDQNDQVSVQEGMLADLYAKCLALPFPNNKEHIQTLNTLFFLEAHSFISRTEDNRMLPSPTFTCKVHNLDICNSPIKTYDDAQKSLANIFGLAFLRPSKLPNFTRRLAWLDELGFSHVTPDQIPRMLYLVKNFTQLKRLLINQCNLENKTLDPSSTLRELEITNCTNVTLNPTIKNLTSLNKLVLINNKLNNLPDEIGCLESLELLNLSDNQLTNLPPTLGQLKQLKILIARKNCLIRITDFIHNLPALTTLDLSDNIISEWPHRYIREEREGDTPLPNLTSLNLSHNRFAQLGCLCVLKSLQHLNLSQNALFYITKIGDLQNLITLDVSHNTIQEFPDLSDIKNLQVFIANNNQIEKIPLSIHHLKELHTLSLAENKLEEVSAEMTMLESPLDYLNLAHNQLKDLPKPWGKELDIQKLDISHNPFDYLPLAALQMKKRGVVVIHDKDLRQVYHSDKNSTKNSSPPFIGTLNLLP